MSRTYVHPTKEEWQAKRPFQIGASEVATIAGVSKYGNIVEMWRKKVEKDATPITNRAMEWGHFFEDGVANVFEARTGIEVNKFSVGDWQFVNNEKQWMTCSPDRTYWIETDKSKRLPGEWSQLGLLECKTTTTDPEAEGNEWLLQSWYCQVQWQLLVAEMEDAHLCCCVFGHERKEVIRHWPANHEFQAKLLQIVTEFWEHNVQQNVAPTPRTKEEVELLFPRQSDGKVAEATEAVNSAWIELKSVNDNLKMLEERKKELTDTLATAFGDAETLEYMGQKLGTYKQNKSSLKFDTDTFKAEHEDLYNKYLVEKAGARVMRLAK